MHSKDEYKFDWKWSESIISRNITEKSFSSKVFDSYKSL